MTKRLLKNKDKIVLSVIRGEVLGITVLRGYARLSDLARISKPDIYDQKANPMGTQRDLSPKHARNAYDYVKTTDIGFWPEVFLCARDRKAVKYIPSENNKDIGQLIIDLKIATDSKKIAISRVDGNHRLHYADGSKKELPPIDKTVSFCLAPDLEHEQEIVLFRDINANQKAMNTSHLDNIVVRITPEETLKRTKPELYIAEKLGNDPESPLCDRIYKSSKKIAGSIIPLRSLQTGIKYMLTRPTKLTALHDTDAQYKVIRNYFQAVKKWQPEVWKDPSKYILLRGSGLWGICFIGTEVIDRALARSKFKLEDMLRILRSGKNWDWSNKGDFQGLGGRGGAVQISNRVTAELQDESGMSIKSLYSKIMDEP
jgi:DGQHR domain-containing protein